MSAFLFYKPNSHPGRYSRRERFSLRHTVLSDNALDNGSDLSMKRSTFAKPARSSVGNELDMNIHNLGQTQSTFVCAETLPQGSDEHDACRTSINDDLDSLHSLFSELDTDSKSNGSVADEVHPAELVSTFSIKDIPPSGSSHSPSRGDTLHTKDSGPNISPSPILQRMDTFLDDSFTESLYPLARHEHLERVDDLVPTGDGDILAAKACKIDEISLKTSDSEAQDSLYLFHNVDCSDATNCTSIPELNELFIENVTGCSGLTTNPSTVASWGDIDVEMQDVPHNLGEAPKSTERASNNTTSSEELCDSSTPLQPSQQRSFTYDTSSDISAHFTELPLSSVQDPQTKRAEFSHVEIRDRRPLEMTRSSVEALGNPVYSPISSCHHPPTTNGPWHLNGTVLSIDLRYAEVPTRFGKSTFHVFDGQVIQILTLVHGPIKAPPPQKPISSAKTSTKKRKLNRPAAAAGRLSPKQKQCLVQLREEGYTWNEVTSRFPGRKKGTLQAAYYTTRKKLNQQASLPRQHPRRLVSERQGSGSLSHRQTETIGNSELRQGNNLEHPRYNLRSRGVR
ncbi:uncharacterized protein ATNIH1004_000988 [Aspergillus tanneri]|uniref:Myb-like domain-containing protein n=1 Tax=Aspergillus tanneri TaxID=1220188 RepID=A0A5M9N3E3_9EURO|nr:uncharacterized protein ATNIH1004_000988 [Aspergillus tanneri]KAA8652084.1 hypothetical protein ATNIH1004_000988 [Aspergillus tanneri]